MSLNDSCCHPKQSGKCLNDSCCHPRHFHSSDAVFQLKFFLHLRNMARTAAKHSAIAARWSGGRVSMGSAGRDRRMRAAQNPRLLKRRTPGKRREESSDHESVVQISDAEQLAIDPDSVPEPALSSRPSAPYTNPCQTSPNRKRGRVRPAEDQVWTLD